MITRDAIERLKEGLDSHSTTYLNGDDGALDLQDAYTVIDQWAKEENEREAKVHAEAKERYASGREEWEKKQEEQEAQEEHCFSCTHCPMPGMKAWQMRKCRNCNDYSNWEPKQ
jgi:hypothetical protein